MVSDPQTETTVMVVDDHPIWRDAVARDLADEGFSVVATADGVASARRRAAVVFPDVVVMDMQLSDGDGVKATAEVLEVSPKSRILVLSASGERDSASANRISSTMACAPASVRRSISSAWLCLFQGQRPIRERLGVSMATIRMSSGAGRDQNFS